MSGARYTPGHSATAVAFMGERSAESHAAFLLPRLRSGMDVLDCGCGPGTITVGLARAVAPGEAHGVDRSGDQFARAHARARAAGVALTLTAGAAERLPYPDGRFDAVLAHALLEHVAEPVAVLTEMARATRPGGLVAAASPDWGGFVVTPPDPRLDGALAAYTELMRANGGEPHAGRHLGEWMRAAGLPEPELGARYEVYADPARIGGYLAEQLERGGAAGAARELRDWAGRPGAMFAQAWVSAIGRRSSARGGRSSTAAPAAPVS